MTACAPGDCRADQARAEAAQHAARAAQLERNLSATATERQASVQADQRIRALQGGIRAAEQDWATERVRRQAAEDALAKQTAAAQRAQAELEAAQQALAAAQQALEAGQQGAMYEPAPAPLADQQGPEAEPAPAGEPLAALWQAAEPEGCATCEALVDAPSEDDDLVVL